MCKIEKLLRTIILAVGLTIMVFGVQLSACALKPMISIPWGDQSGEFGRIMSTEKDGQNVNGAQLLVVDGDDSIYVNDQVNMKIMKFDKSGKYADSYSVPGYRKIEFMQIPRGWKEAGQAVKAPVVVATSAGNIGRIGTKSIDWIPRSIAGVTQIQEFAVNPNGTYIVGHQGLYDKDEVTWILNDKLTCTGIMDIKNISCGSIYYGSIIYGIAKQEWVDQPNPGMQISVKTIVEQSSESKNYLIPGSKKMTVHFLGVWDTVRNIDIKYLYFYVKDIDVNDKVSEKIVRFSTDGKIKNELSLDEVFKDDKSVYAKPGRLCIKSNGEIVVATMNDKGVDLYRLRVPVE